MTEVGSFMTCANEAAESLNDALAAVSMSGGQDLDLRKLFGGYVYFVGDDFYLKGTFFQGHGVTLTGRATAYDESPRDFVNMLGVRRDCCSVVPVPISSVSQELVRRYGAANLESRFPSEQMEIRASLYFVK